MPSRSAGSGNEPDVWLRRRSSAENGHEAPGASGALPRIAGCTDAPPAEMAGAVVLGFNVPVICNVPVSSRLEDSGPAP